MYLLLSIIITIAVAMFMECIAWAEHKYVMHGFLWYFHEDHHRPSKGPFEKNDLFALFFAVPSFLFIFFGLRNGLWFLPPIGYGMAAYGLGYVLFHDIMFHRRFKSIKIPARSKYFQGIINAHRIHHRNNTKEDGQSFGFLWAPKKFAG